LLPGFLALGITVIGVSSDPLGRLQLFRDKYDLRFSLVSDRDRAIGLAYGTLKDGVGSSHERDTVLIGKDGIVQLAYERVAAKGHAEAVLADAKRLGGQEGL
jgi:peroxiredoxin Q/BCP